MSSGTSKLEEDCLSGNCQHQHQQGRLRLQKWCSVALPSLERVPTSSCLSGSHFKIGKWVSFTNGPGAFQTAASALGYRVGESMYEPFKSEFSISQSSMGLLDVIPFIFQSQSFWELVSSIEDARVGVLVQGQTPCSSGKSSVFLRCLLFVGWHALDMIFGGGMALPLLPVSFTFFVKAPFIQFSGVFSEEIFYIQLWICRVCKKR